jgi:dihydroorotate dehydrogenase electron transfer subunit
VKPFSALVTNIRQVLADVHLLELEAPDIAGTVKPGQFVMVTCGSEETLLPRPLSVFGVSQDLVRIRLLLAIKGTGTAWLAGRRTGERVKVMGPLGNGFMLAPKWKNLLLVAGGLGIAPLAYLAAEHAGDRQLTLVAGAASKAGLLTRSDISEGVNYVVTTEDGSAGVRGLVTSVAQDLATDADAVFCCGPLGMLRSMAGASWLKEKPVQASLEVRMGCGSGLCFGCTILTKAGPKRVCSDGPVFPLGIVEWDSVRC